MTEAAGTAALVIGLGNELRGDDGAGIAVARQVRSLAAAREIDVLELQTEPGRRRLAIAGLCLLMALLFALALIVPFLRNFYELSKPTGEALAAFALGSALGVATMLGALRLVQV